MITPRQSLQNFKERMNELITSKYILADNKVSEVLKTISDSTLLYEIFEHVTQNFDYDTFKSVCFSFDEDGKGEMTLPKKDDDVLAFCFLLLMELDAKKIDLLELCSICFSAEEGKQASFNAFAENVLVPFANLTEKVANILINGEIPQNNEASEETEKEEEIGVDEDDLRPSVIYKSQIIATQLKAEISTKKMFDKKAGDEYDEVLFVLDQLITYVGRRNVEGITLAFTALKYICEAVKKFKIDLESLKESLSEAL